MRVKVVKGVMMQGVVVEVNITLVMVVTVMEVEEVTVQADVAMEVEEVTVHLVEVQVVAVMERMVHL